MVKVDVAASQAERRYSRRNRKPVNYNENKISKSKDPDSDDEPLISKKKKNIKDNFDSDFEPVSKKKNISDDDRDEDDVVDADDAEENESDDDDDFIIKKNVAKKKTPKTKKAINKISTTTNESSSGHNEQSFTPIVGFVNQPNLSEDESSDSECDDTDSNAERSNDKTNNKLINNDKNMERKTNATNTHIKSVVKNEAESSSIFSVTPVSSLHVQNNKNIKEENSKSSKRKRIQSNTTVENSSKRSKEENQNDVNDKEKRENKKLNESTSRKSKRKSKKVIQETTTTIENNGVRYSSSDDDGNGWEEVDEVKVKASPKKKRKIKEDKVEEDSVELKDVQIDVGVQSIHKKKKSRAEKMFIWIRQSLGRVLRERQVLYHKCHLLCLLSKSIRENQICNTPEIQGLCLSLISHEFVGNAAKNWNVNHLQRFLKWFKLNDVKINEKIQQNDTDSGKYFDQLAHVHILVIMLRVLGFLTRIIYSFQPCTAKVKKDQDATSPTVETKKTGKSKVNSTTNDKTASSKNSPYFNKKESTPKSSRSNKKEHESKKKNVVRVTDTNAIKNEEVMSTQQQLNSLVSGSNSGYDLWLEVYLEPLKDWICYELMSDTLNKPYDIEKVATKPLQYIVALDNKNKIKDVTCRYASKWLSYNRKLRTDRDWWAETLAPYEPPNDIIHSTEDAKLKKLLMEKDFPTSISDFKDNPLYALKRHLLKFQAIYPESAVPLGYIRSEAIYSRDCVRELHTRETWMKQALVVKQGEVAYKVVKGRPKRNTPISERDKVTVDLFGKWQTEPYIPPPVVDGKVPRNEYGNVELFKPCMLPAGAVHLPLNNIQRIARKLKIDCAPAMMGWDFHGGFSHPIIEGIVVAKEFEDVLLDAWQKDEEEQERKEKERREKIIYENWKTLIKGLLIRNKLQKKYNFLEEAPTTSKNKTHVKTSKDKSKSGPPKKKNVAKKPTIANDEYSNLSVSWPANKMGGTTSLSTDGHVHVFLEENNKVVNDTLMKFCTCGLSLPVDNEEEL